jgi:hypothetical protein
MTASERIRQARAREGLRPVAPTDRNARRVRAAAIAKLYRDHGWATDAAEAVSLSADDIESVEEDVYRAALSTLSIPDNSCHRSNAQWRPSV